MAASPSTPTLWNAVKVDYKVHGSVDGVTWVQLASTATGSLAWAATSVSDGRAWRYLRVEGVRTWHPYYYSNKGVDFAGFRMEWYGSLTTAGPSVRAPRDVWASVREGLHTGWQKAGEVDHYRVTVLRPTAPSTAVTTSSTSHYFFATDVPPGTVLEVVGVTASGDESPTMRYPVFESVVNLSPFLERVPLPGGFSPERLHNSGHAFDTAVVPTESGRKLVVAAISSNAVVPADTNGVDDAYLLVKHPAGNWEISPLTLDFASEGNIRSVRLSGDGSTVVLTTSRKLTAEDTEDFEDVFVRATSDGAQWHLLSATPDGGYPNGASRYAVVSTDGTQVAFASLASDLFAGDVNAKMDVFVADRGEDTLLPVSVTEHGWQTMSSGEAPAITPDGRYVSFWTTSSAPGDSTEKRRVMVVDRQPWCESEFCDGVGFSTQVESSFVAASHNRAYTASNSLIGGNWAYNVKTGRSAILPVADLYMTSQNFSPSGRLLATCYNPTANYYAQDHVRVYDVESPGQPTLAFSTPMRTGNVQNTCDDATVADDGTVFYTAVDDRLVDNDNNGASDLFVYSPILNLSPSTPPEVKAPLPDRRPVDLESVVLDPALQDAAQQALDVFEKVMEEAGPYVELLEGFDKKVSADAAAPTKDPEVRRRLVATMDACRTELTGPTCPVEDALGFADEIEGFLGTGDVTKLLAATGKHKSAWKSKVDDAHEELENAVALLLTETTCLPNQLGQHCQRAR